MSCSDSTRLMTVEHACAPQEHRYTTLPASIVAILRGPVMPTIKSAVAVTLLALGLHAAAASQTKVVVLDTGHSPTSPGAISASGYGEYFFNLNATNQIAQALQQRGVQVIRTGHDGHKWSLAARAAQALNAGLFLSIHHDSIQQTWLDQGREGEFSGFAVLVSMKNVKSQQSAQCARLIGAAMRQAGELPSLYHATPIKGENRPLIDKHNGVHRFDDLVVLRASKAPAVLLEVGVIVNPVEERKLASPQFVRQYADSVAEAVVTCLSKGP